MALISISDKKVKIAVLYPTSGKAPQILLGLFLPCPNEIFTLTLGAFYDAVSGMVESISFVDLPLRLLGPSVMLIYNLTVQGYAVQKAGKRTQSETFLIIFCT